MLTENSIPQNGYWVTVVTGVENYDSSDEQYVGHLLLEDHIGTKEYEIAKTRIARGLDDDDSGRITYHVVQCALPDEVVWQIQNDAIEKYKRESKAWSDDPYLKTN